MATGVVCVLPRVLQSLLLAYCAAVPWQHELLNFEHVAQYCVRENADARQFDRTVPSLQFPGWLDLIPLVRGAWSFEDTVKICACTPGRLRRAD